jgi:hypothetical protein
MEETPLLANMVGKRVLLEWVGVAPPQNQKRREKMKKMRNGPIT